MSSIEDLEREIARQEAIRARTRDLLGRREISMTEATRIYTDVRSRIRQLQAQIQALEAAPPPPEEPVTPIREVNLELDRIRIQGFTLRQLVSMGKMTPQQASEIIANLDEKERALEAEKAARAATKDQEQPPTDEANKLYLQILELDRKIAYLENLRETGVLPAVVVDPDIEELQARIAELEAQEKALAGLLEAPPLTNVPMDRLFAQFANIGPMNVDVARAGVIADGVKTLLASAGLDAASVQKLRGSTVDPEDAAEAAGNIMLALGAGVSLLYTVGIIAETLSLGQIESVTHAITGVLEATGVKDLAANFISLPFNPGLVRPAEYHWNAVFTPEIPGPGDLITFVVREVIPPEVFTPFMANHGFNEFWSQAYWEAHWRLPSRDEIVDAFHRGLLTDEERDVFLVLHDLKPDPRPGISKSDMTLIAAIQKTLIPRVDLRRGWELGLLSDARLLKGYKDLGYEEDAATMATIQKAIALSGERTAVARAAGRLFRDNIWPEDTFRETLTEIKITGEAQDLWVLRYQLERLGKAPPAEEAAEEVAPPPAEES